MNRSRARLQVLVAIHAIFAASLACAASAGGSALQLASSGHCLACHSGSAASGQEVAIGAAWRGSMMANSARDPYWQASVRREVMDYPGSQAEIEDACATCHMPMSRAHANARGERGKVFDHVSPSGNSTTSKLALDGVSCSLCHQILSENLGTQRSLSGGFELGQAGAKPPVLFGPFDVDEGRQNVMHSATGFLPAKATHVQQSELCATCHTLYTHALDASGRQVGRLPEQMPYLEWKHSDHASMRSCQDCHMPVIGNGAPITSVLAQSRDGVSRHSFEGSNAHMLRILSRYREPLGVTATAQELDAAVSHTLDFLQTRTAQIAIEVLPASKARLELDVIVRNLAGHKLPTAYPSRRAWLQVLVRDATGSVIFESGAVQVDGSIAGNANDADPGQFEGHYSRIERSDQVQIYESVMVDSAGHVTTGLLSATAYVKDNRLLPDGFDKATASADIAVHGNALEDSDFRAGGDRVRYSIALDGRSGALSVTARLLFQSIGHRWAHNLERYPAAETGRFLQYYRQTSDTSATVLAAAEAQVNVNR